VKVIPLTGKLFLFLIQAASHFSTDGFVKGFLFLGQVRRGLFRLSDHRHPGTPPIRHCESPVRRYARHTTPDFPDG
jgi:hypothetical protein